MAMIRAVAARTAIASGRQALRNAVFPEPLELTSPCVVRRRFVIAGTIVGEETVAGFGVDDDLGILTGFAERGLHLVHLIERDAVILAAVKSDDGSFQLRRH